jgi:hypothetical protein
MDCTLKVGCKKFIDLYRLCLGVYGHVKICSYVSFGTSEDHITSLIFTYYQIPYIKKSHTIKKELVVLQKMLQNVRQTKKVKM